MEAADTRTVSLAVPPDPEFLVLGRLALGALCRLTSLRPDEVVDLKLAVTEAAAGVLNDGEDPRPPAGRIAFAFELEPDRLVLEVRGSLPCDLTLEQRRQGKAIVEATIDSCEDLGEVIRFEKELEPDER